MHMKKKQLFFTPSFALIFIFLLVSGLFFSCSNQESKNYHTLQKEWALDNGKIKVLSTVAMIDELVKAIGGEYVDSLTLIKGDLDPHSYQLVKGDDEKLQKAQIIFFNGLGLEHGPSLQHYLYKSEKAIGLGNEIEKQNPQLILYDEGEKDPHIWMDISLFGKSIPFIEKALSEKDPMHGDYYKTRAKELQKELERTNEQVRELLSSVPEQKRYLVTSHDAFNYFTKAYLAKEDEQQNNEWKKRFAAPEGLAPESQISSLDIQLIIDYLEKNRVHVLFPESNVSQDSIRKIVQAGSQKGLDIQISKETLYGDAMGPFGSDGDSYLKMILHNAKVISNHLNEAGSN